MVRSHVYMLFSALMVFSGCVQRLAIRSMEGIIDNGLIAFNEESDITIAHEALASNLKLIEALIKSDPKNEKFLTFAAQGFSAYALAFCEDDSIERARLFYLRARDYGLSALNKNSAFKEAFNKDIDSFKKAVFGFKKKDVPIIFWTALSWGSYINISRSDISALADISKVQALMEFVTEKDPTYYYGGAYLLLGTIEANIPKALGGNLDKAKDYFDKCFKINDGKFLLAKLYYAQTYAVAMQDRELFESVLNEIDNVSVEILPEARLVNAVAKKKAKKLLTQVDDLF